MTADAPPHPHPHPQWKLARWPSFAAACLMMSIGGVSYVFSLYSAVLKERFGLTQTQLDLISTAENLAGLLGFVGGFLYNRLGPSGASLLCAAMAVPAWSLMWASVAMTTWVVPYSCLLLISFAQGMTAALLDSVAVVSVAQNFPQHYGRALGVVKAFVGMSAGRSRPR